MRKYLYPAIVLALQVVSPQEGFSKDNAAPCFCMEHIASGAVRCGCEELQAPNAAAPRVWCFKGPDAEEKGVIEPPEGYRRVPEGAGQCNPCNPAVARSRPDHPRLPGETQ